MTNKTGETKMSEPSSRQYQEDTERQRLVKFGKDQISSMKKFMTWWAANHKQQPLLFPLEMPEAVWYEHFWNWNHRQKFVRYVNKKK